MKTIVNCNPIEFIEQTNKIRHAVSKYFKDTKILEIRKRKPTDGVTIEEQAKKNLNDMLDVAMGEYPRETAEVIGLMCFIEPTEIEKYTAAEFLTPALELLNSKAALNFFISLAKLEQTPISD